MKFHPKTQTTEPRIEQIHGKVISIRIFKFVQCLGNHEFDDGIQNLVQYLEHTKIPTVAANLNRTSEKRLNSLVKDSIVLNIKGHKIGVVGYITPDTMVRKFYYQIGACTFDTQLFTRELIVKLVITEAANTDPNLSIFSEIFPVFRFYQQLKIQKFSMKFHTCERKQKS